MYPEEFNKQNRSVYAQSDLWFLGIDMYMLTMLFVYSSEYLPFLHCLSDIQKDQHMSWVR